MNSSNIPRIRTAGAGFTRSRGCQFWGRCTATTAIQKPLAEISLGAILTVGAIAPYWRWPAGEKPLPASAVRTCSGSCPSGDALACPGCRGMGCAAAIHRWFLQRFPSVYLMLRHREARKSRKKSPKNTLALRARSHVLSPYWAWWTMTLDLTYSRGESRSNELSWPHLAF
jgi:hypothetical protein